MDDADINHCFAESAEEGFVATGRGDTVVDNCELELVP